MKANGQRHSGSGDQKSKSRGTIPKLSNLGISLDQSSKWQQLAAIPEEEFENAVRGDGPKPSTEGLINAQKLKGQEPKRMDPDALWLWGRVCDFERNGYFSKDPAGLLREMTDSMRSDIERITPSLIGWFLRLGARGDAA